MEAAFQPHALTYSGDYAFNAWTQGEEYSPDLHYHDFYEIQIYLEGTRHLLVGNQTYACTPGDIVFLNMFEQHRLIKSEPGSYRRCTFSLSPGMVLSMCTERTDIRGLFSSQNRSYPIHHFPEAEFAVYLDLIRRYREIGGVRGRELLERGIIYEFLGRLYGDCCDGVPDRIPNTHHSAMVAKIVEYVNGHLDQDLSLETLSRVSNFSVYHMCRVFKKITGCTISQYISSKRMSRARLLLQTDCPITQIAAQAGFRNYSCFYKAFLKENGVSPAQYRERQIQISKNKE